MQLHPAAVPAPLALVVTPKGAHLLLTSEPGAIILAAIIRMLAMAPLAAGTAAWIRDPGNSLERPHRYG